MVSHPTCGHQALFASKATSKMREYEISVNATNMFKGVFLITPHFWRFILIFITYPYPDETFYAYLKVRTQPIFLFRRIEVFHHSCHNPDQDRKFHKPLHLPQWQHIEPYTAKERFNLSQGIFTPI